MKKKTYKGISNEESHFSPFHLPASNPTDERSFSSASFSPFYPQWITTHWSKGPQFEWTLGTDRRPTNTSYRGKGFSKIESTSSWDRARWLKVSWAHLPCESRWEKDNIKSELPTFLPRTGKLPFWCCFVLIIKTCPPCEFVAGWTLKSPGVVVSEWLQKGTHSLDDRSRMVVVVAIVGCWNVCFCLRSVRFRVMKGTLSVCVFQ